MDKLKMQTPNLVDENIEKIGKIFPECITEHKKSDGTTELAVDFDRLRLNLSKSPLVEGYEERYQFTWPDKQKTTRLACVSINKTLRPCREKSVEFDNTENLYIEGDNLEVLKLLREDYLGKVKMMYIDPPYNTGKDLIYPDNFVRPLQDYINSSSQKDGDGNHLIANTESNGRFHTDWLNMIYPRLKVARDLLSDDGIILINMDEHEISNLQKICCEIFGEYNDLGTMIWDKRNPKGDARGISYQHEYILFFAKNKDSFCQHCKMVRPKKNARAMLAKAKQLFSKIGAIYSLDDANNDFAKWLSLQNNLSGGERAYNRIDENGRLYQAVSMAWPNNKKAPDDYFIPLIHPKTGKPCPVPSKGWRNPSSTMLELQKNGLILFGETELTQPRRKYLLEDNMYENIPSLLYYGGSDINMLNALGIPFDTPKVVDICKEHIQSLTDNDSIVMDFFSGSATVAHAVMKANLEDNGKRKFIMVQIPEIIKDDSEASKAGFKNICELGEERIRRAGNKIIEEFEENHSDTANVNTQKPDIGFRVLKLDSSNMKDVYYKPSDITNDLFAQTEDNIKEDRTDEDLLFQVMLELSVPLSAKIRSEEICGKKVMIVDDDYLIACFDMDITDEVVTDIAKRKPQYFVMRDSSAMDDSVITNFETIFQTYSNDTVRKIL